MNKIEYHTIKTKGIITPTDWDDDGKVIEISLSLPGEIDYIIELNKKGKKLLKFVNKEVKLVGKLYQDKLKREFINIIDFDLVKNNED